MKKDRKKKIQETFLEALEKTPIIEHACDVAGVSRNSIYRWQKESVRFKNKVEKALFFGVDRVNDYAENNLLNGIKNGDIGVTKYWLGHRHPSYRNNYFEKIRSDRKKLEQEKNKLEIERARNKILEWQAGWFKEDKN